MTEYDFEVLTETHKTIASSWSSKTMSCVTVLGNEFGTPIAIRYISQETNGEFLFIKFPSAVTINQEKE